MKRKPTWNGYVSTLEDAQKIIHACSKKYLHSLPRRLNEAERVQIVRHGAVFVFEESEASMTRWTDNLKCGRSKISGPFLLYTELQAPDGQLPLTRRSVCFTKKVVVDGKPSIEKWHLVAYYNREFRTLRRVSDDPVIGSLNVKQNVYRLTRRLCRDNKSSNSSSRSSSSPISGHDRSVSPSPLVDKSPSTNSQGSLESLNCDSEEDLHEDLHSPSQRTKLSISSSSDQGESRTRTSSLCSTLFSVRVHNVKLEDDPKILKRLSWEEKGWISHAMLDRRLPSLRYSSLGNHHVDPRTKTDIEYVHHSPPNARPSLNGGLGS